MLKMLLHFRGMHIAHFSRIPSSFQRDIAEQLMNEWLEDFASSNATTPDAVQRLILDRYGTWRGQKAVFFVATLDNGRRLVGTASVEFELDAKLTPCLANLFIAPELRSCGFGKLLVRFCERYVKKQGLSAIYLWCNIELVPYYEKLGYKTVETTQRGLKTVHFMGRAIENNLI